MNFHRFNEILENQPKRDLLLAELKRLFPGAFLKTSEEFSPDREGGIWITGREMADYYGKDNSGFGYYVNPRLQKTLEKHGFYLEPYDPETWFAWEVTPIRREAKDLLNRNIPSGPLAPNPRLGSPRPFLEPRPMPATLVRLDTRNSRKASEMTYDPQKGEAEVTYRDGNKRKFRGLDYEKAKNAGASSKIDDLIQDLETGR